MPGVGFDSRLAFVLDTWLIALIVCCVRCASECDYEAFAIAIAFAKMAFLSAM